MADQRQPPSAAQALYGHLPSAAPEPVQQRRNSLADAMWPQLSRAAKAKDRDQALWDEIVKRQRDNFLRDWRERGR
jgi:hypothetical protein